MNEWLNWIELNWIGLNWIELNDWVNEWVKQWKNAWMNEWMNDWMDGWMNECMNECVKWNETKWNQMKWTETKWLTWMKERMSEWMSEAMNAWMNHWSNECMNEWMKRKEWNEWTQWNEWNESNAWNAWLQGMKWLNDTELMSAWLHECLKEERKGKRNEWKVDFVLIFFVRARRIAFARAGWRVVSWADSWWSNDSKGLHSSTQILIIFFCSLFGRVEHDMAMRTAFKRQTLRSMQQMLGQHRSDFSFKVILWCCVVFSVFGLGPVLAHGWHMMASSLGNRALATVL